MISPTYKGLLYSSYIYTIYIIPSLERVYQLMNNKNADVICKLAAFVQHVLQRKSAPEFVFAL